MTKVKMLGLALIGAAMAMTGCAGGATSAAPAQLDVSTVAASIDGRTDLFLDPMLSTHLLTADEVNGSPTAVAVEVQIVDDQLIAWRAQPTLGAAERTRAPSDVVARFQIEGPVDLSTATPIGNTTRPGDPTTVIIPSGQLGSFQGSRGGAGSSTRPPLSRLPTVTGYTINWGGLNGIPNAVDVNTYHNIVNAHPGCA